MIYHTTSIWPSLAEDAVHHSWDEIYTQGVVPVHITASKLNDVIHAGLQQADDGDIVFWTNSDILISPNLPVALSAHCAKYPVCSSRRVDFDTGEPHIGRDLFAATKKWWIEHWEEVPDAFIGSEAFDLHFACLIRAFYSIKFTVPSLLKEDIHPAELPSGLLRHKDHAATWRLRSMGKVKKNEHNRLLFFKWAQEHMPELNFNVCTFQLNV